MACRESYATTCPRYRARNPRITPFCCSVGKQLRTLSFSSYVDVKGLRDGLLGRVVALHARPQEILATANFFPGGDLGWTYGAAGQGFRENQGMEFTEKGI